MMKTEMLILGAPVLCQPPGHPIFLSKVFLKMVQSGSICRQFPNSILKKTRKGVTELRGPALVCLSAIDKKSVYGSSSWVRILNVQDLIKERTKETSSNISPTCISSTTMRKHVAFNQCCFNVEPRTVFDTGPSLKQHWVIVPCFLTAALCW